MPQYSSNFDTEAVKWRKLVQNLYADVGVDFPFSSAPWQTYVRGIMAVWGADTYGPEGALIKNFAKALAAEYGLSVTFDPYGQPADYLYRVALAASGVCRCPGRGIYESLGTLIDWSAAIAGYEPSLDFSDERNSQYIALIPL